jgi:integrase
MNQPNVKMFLQKKMRNSKRSAETYLSGLTRLQEFLNLNANKYQYPVNKVNELSSLFIGEKQKQKQDVYQFFDSFISYLIENKISRNTIRLYVAAAKGYLENCDVEINPTKFKNKVTMPKNHRQDEAAIDDADIRKILLACNNFRLKVYLLLLASGGMRAIEALAIRLKDIDFSVTPTRIHIREEYSKTRTSRDIYISEEATTYVKQFIERKYSVQGFGSTYAKRIRNEDDLLFQMQQRSKSTPEGIYNKMMLQFQMLLKSIGLEERKDGMTRRKITFHSFRRFVKTVIANNTSTDYSEWFLGHAKSPYFVQKELDKRMLYATKCMPFLTFINYSQLEHNASVKQTEVEMLMMKDANKDREIEVLKQKLQVKDREVELLKQRDATQIEKVQQTTDVIGDLAQTVKRLEKEMADMKATQKSKH